MPMGMSVNDLVLVQGMHDTRLALTRWNRTPWRVLGPWLALSVLIACGLLVAVYVVARVSPPDSTPLVLPGHGQRTGLPEYGHLLYRNSLVLALHAMACVAGFIAGSSVPLSASRRNGFSRWLHLKAGPLAIAFVVGATAFSLGTQAYALGGGVSTAAAQLGISRGLLILALLPHALPELIALFLPLAAWLVASRRDEWHELLAATFVTVGVAAPVLLASAAIEVWGSPHLLNALTG
jgi:hypothetical protein